MSDINVVALEIGVITLETRQGRQTVFNTLRRWKQIAGCQAVMLTTPMMSVSNGNWLKDVKSM